MSAALCNCQSQIVWYFDKPTVYVCVACEIALHYSEEKCPRCGGPITAFKCEESDLPEE